MSFSKREILIISSQRSILFFQNTNGYCGGNKELHRWPITLIKTIQILNNLWLADCCKNIFKWTIKMKFFFQTFNCSTTISISFFSQVVKAIVDTFKGIDDPLGTLKWHLGIWEVAEFELAEWTNSLNPNSQNGRNWRITISNLTWPNQTPKACFLLPKPAG